MYFVLLGRRPSFNILESFVGGLNLDLHDLIPRFSLYLSETWNKLTLRILTLVPKDIIKYETWVMPVSFRNPRDPKQDFCAVLAWIPTHSEQIGLCPFFPVNHEQLKSRNNVVFLVMAVIGCPCSKPVPLEDPNCTPPRTARRLRRLSAAFDGFRPLSEKPTPCIKKRATKRIICDHSEPTWSYSPHKIRVSTKTRNVVFCLLDLQLHLLAHRVLLCGQKFARKDASASQ